MSGSGDILVVGGGSRIAGGLVPLLGDAGAYVSRRATGKPRETLVEDYGDVPAALFAGRACVINCVGVSTGNAVEQQKVNVGIPLALARAAKAAGVGRFLHVSSFSIYGKARLIDRHTRPVPTGDYGRSKLRADQALMAVADARFGVALLRLPLIYGEALAGKLRQLMRLWVRLGVLPVPSGDVGRAMIGVDLAAEVLARLARDSAGGILFASDPTPFSYRAAAEARPEPLRRLLVPRSLTGAVEHVLPSLGSRLFADSRLAEADNLAIRYGLRSRLLDDIAQADLR